MKRKRLNSKIKGESMSPKAKDEDKVTVDIDDTDADTPLRPIFCLKKIVDLERFDENEDCYLLDFDPFHSPINLTTLSSISKEDHLADSEISLLAEKGQVACRDYPHARYLCLKFPFQTTPHQTHCHLCYCYVCDAKAPCDHWTTHCHASHTDLVWKLKRQFNTNSNTNTTPPTLLH